MLNRRKLITQAALAAPALILPRAASAFRNGKQPSPGDVINVGMQGHTGLGFDFGTHGGLRVNSSGRYLEANDGTYFPWVADTAWELMGQLTLAETTTYLENRRTQGYTMINCCPIGIGYQTNRNGDQNFTGGNVATPNSNWWSFVDSVVAVGAVKGIGFLFMPIWDYALGSGTISIGSFTGTQAANFGTFIGGRYASSPNVLFAVGGDYVGAPPSQYTNLGVALKAAAPSTLITAHPGGAATSATDFQSDSWLDFSGAQSSHGSQNNALAISLITTGWNASPTKPTINLESTYENGGINFSPSNGYFTAFDARQQMWWSLGAGGFGSTYGNQAVWPFQRPGQSFLVPTDSPQYPDWYNALGLPVQPAGSQSLYVRNLLAARPGLRTPDQTLVTGALSGGNTLVCCRGPNFAWIYSGGGDTFTVNMGKISGTQVKAYWYSPRDGLVVDVDTYANSGTQSFTPPLPRGALGNDWVLLLDDASTNFAIPGAV